MSNILDILDEVPEKSFLTEQEFYNLPVNENYAKTQLEKLEKEKNNEIKKV